MWARVNIKAFPLAARVDQKPFLVMTISGIAGKCRKCI
jgi:hypothetical protein